MFALKACPTIDSVVPSQYHQLLQCAINERGERKRNEEEKATYSDNSMVFAV